MSNFDVDISDDIATVTFDRPPVNAIDRPSMADLGEIFGSFRDRKDVRAAIFTATGKRAFIAGVDLNTLDQGATADPPLSKVLDPGSTAREAMWAITDCPVPVIAAVNGPAIGAGLAFVACCDMIVAADTATFGTTEINVGLLGASAQLSRLVGRYKAREMFLTGELVPAAELHRIGTIRTVVPHDELAATARDLAAVLASKSPIAMRLAKEAMNRVEDLPLKDAYRIEQDYTARMLGFEDAAEARQAYVDKRAPDWKWR